MNFSVFKQRFNFSAFFLTWIWALGHGLYRPALITVVLTFLLTIVLPYFITGVSYEVFFIPVKLLFLIGGLIFAVGSAIYWGWNGDEWLRRRNKTSRFHWVWFILGILLNFAYVPIYGYLLFFLMATSITCVAGNPAGCP